MLRGHAGEDRDLRHRGTQGGRVHPCQLGAGHHPFGGDAKLGRHRLGRVGVVAGDHDGTDARRPAAGHGLNRRRLGRIDHALEAGEGQAAQVFVAQIDMIPRHLPEGQAQGAQGLAGEAPRGLLPVVSRQWPNGTSGFELGGAHHQHRLGGTLDEDEPAPGGVG